MIISKSNFANYGLVFDDSVKAYSYGAKQLNKYVERCCNFTFDNYSGQKNFISIGYNEKSSNLIDNADKSTLKQSGLRIAFKDGNVYIYGGSEKGTVYGVFEFVERYLGVKFLTSVDEITPQADAIILDEKDVECNPCFPQRDCSTFSFMVNPDYVLKRRYEGPNTPDHPEAGIINNTWFNDIPNTHNSHYFVPREKYMDSHPEMFSTPNPDGLGKFGGCTLTGGSHIECCYSNGVTDDGKLDESLEVSTVKVVADSLYNYIINNPDKKYFMFGRQDNGGAICYCPRCVEKRKRYGGEAGTMIIFLNVVIDVVEKRLIAEGKTPDFNLVTFAYQSTLQAPVDENLQPVDNLIIPCERLHIRYASLGANSAYGYTDKRQDKKILDSVIGWTNVTKNLMFYDYPVNYIDNLYFFPIYLHLAEDIRFFNKVGMSYVMYEEAFGSTQGYHIEMDSYVISKLFWNPERDIYDVMKEYIDNYYGIAADYVYEYRCKMLSFFKDFVDKGLRIQPTHPWCDFLYPENYPLEVLTECVDILDKGLEVIEKSNISIGQKHRLSKRVKRVLLSPLRMITRNTEYYFGDKGSVYDKRFPALIDELGHIISRTPHRIIEGNVVNYKIMIDKTDAECQKYADYLNEWFKNKTGLTLEVIDQHDAYPTYAEKVICIGPNDFAKEFFQKTDFSIYNVFVKSRGAAIFLVGKNLKDSCDIMIDRFKEKTWCANVTGRYTSLKMEFTEIIEFLK